MRHASIILLACIVLAIAAASLLLAACGGSVPETRFYDLSGGGARRAAAPAGGVVLAIEPLEVDQPYDDDRIVYRTTPVRIDYYAYHRWSSPPGTLVANQLERALERSGRFRAVMREPGAGAAAYVLGGRLVALEEVNVSKRRWIGRVALELHLRDAASDEVIWSAEMEETQPLVRQSPEGLARALGIAMNRVAARITPQLLVAAGRASQPAAAAAR